MWFKYFDPPFILPPKHAAVFREAASSLSFDVGWEDWEDDWSPIGVKVFDRLSQAQKQATILEVVRALLDASVEPPEVTSVLAGTVDAIYRELGGRIEMEISFGEQTAVRNMVLEAAAEMDYWQSANSGLEPDEEPCIAPAPGCADYEEWSPLVEALWGTVLEDCDFDMVDEFLDMPPAEAAARKKQMNINPEYFTEIAPDPTPTRILAIREELSRLVTLRPNDGLDRPS
jgi:hypothetical protein